MVKDTLKLAAIIILIWIWLPTGPADLFTIPIIISMIGYDMYILLSIIFVIMLYKMIEGKTLRDKLKNVIKEVKNGI